MPPRPRIVRKQPFFDRLLSAPLDWWLSVQESFETVEWDRLQLITSWPVALILNGLFITVKLGHWFEEPAVSVHVLRNNPATQTTYERHKRNNSLNFWLTFTEYLLILFTLLNSIYVFTRTRRYTMMETEVEHPPSSPNARVVQFESATEPAWARTFPGIVIYPLYRAYASKSGTSRVSRREVWELNAWNPPVFGLNVFAWFSPLQAFVLYGLDEDNWTYFLPITAFVCFQMHYTVTIFRTHLKDKQIIFASVMREYNSKLVNPRLFVRRYDMATEAGDGEDVGGGEDGEDVGVGKPRYPVGAARKWATTVEDEEDEEEEEEEEEEGEEEERPRKRLWFGFGAAKGRGKGNDISPAEKSSPHKTNENVFQRRGR